MTRLRSGQVCAAYVQLPGEDGEDWIITRIEKTLPNGDYVVRDVDPDSKQNEHYVVKPNHVTHFPATNLKYQPGERVLALWYNEEVGEWSTMFYEATVVRSDDSKLVVEFTGTSVCVETDEKKLARLPPDFDSAPDAPEKETKAEAEDAPRRIHFVRGEEQNAIPRLERITNEQLTEMMEPNIPIKRVVSVEGTPLIDMLEDPELFPQDAPHVMVSGSMRIQHQARARPRAREAALLESEKKVGRLTRIFKEWRV